MAKSAKKAAPGTIAQNRRARHDYFIEQKFEAGVMLMGWEVKSIRDGKVQLAESYVQLHKGEAFLTFDRHKCIFTLDRHKGILDILQAQKHLDI